MTDAAAAAAAAAHDDDDDDDDVIRAGLWSGSQRLGLETVQRLVSFSSRSREADVSVLSRSRPFTSRAQDQLSAKLFRPH